MPITTPEQKPANASNIQRGKQKQGKDLTLCSHDPLRRKITFQNGGEKSLPDQNKSARKRREKNPKTKERRTVISLCRSAVPLGLSVGMLTGWKSSTWIGKSGKVSVTHVRSRYVLSLAGSCRFTVPSLQYSPAEIFPDGHQKCVFHKHPSVSTACTGSCSSVERQQML